MLKPPPPKKQIDGSGSAFTQGMKLKVDFDIQLPSIPNFIWAISNGETITIPINAISNEDLEQIGIYWMKALIATAEKRRKQPA